jgi:zinc transporter ZupT
MWYFALFIIIVVASGGLVLWYQPKNLLFSKLLLSFSGAYLFGLIFLHLIPEIYSEVSWNIGLYILLGFLLQLGLDYFSKGIEHGHAHYHDKKFPLAIFIGLCLHSFFEGMPILHYSPNQEIEMNVALIWGIMIHKIPIAIVLAGLLKDRFSTLKSMLFLTLFAITLPLGSLLSINISSLLLDQASYEHITLAIVVGIMLHVSTTILYESDENHKFNLQKVISIITGFIIAYFTS